MPSELSATPVHVDRPGTASERGDNAAVVPEDLASARAGRALTPCRRRAGLRAGRHPIPAIAPRTCRRQSNPAPPARLPARRQTGSSRLLRRRRRATSSTRGWCPSWTTRGGPCPLPSRRRRAAARRVERDAAGRKAARASKLCTGRLRQLMFLPVSLTSANARRRRRPRAS